MVSCVGVSAPRSRTRQDEAAGLATRAEPFQGASEAQASGPQCDKDEGQREPAECRAGKPDVQLSQPSAVPSPARKQQDIPSLSVSSVWATSPKNICKAPSSRGARQEPAFGKGKLLRLPPRRTAKMAAASGPGSLFRSVSQGRMPDTSTTEAQRREYGSARKPPASRAADCSDTSPANATSSPISGVDGASLHRGTQAQRCACGQLDAKSRGASGKASGRKARLTARERHGGSLGNRHLDNQPEEASEDVFRTWIAESERQDQLKNTGTDLPPRHLNHPFLASLRSHPDNPLRFIEKQALASFSSFSPSLCSRVTSAAASGRRTPRILDTSTSSTTDAAVAALFNQVPKPTASPLTKTPRAPPLSGNSAEDFLQLRTEFAVSRVLSALASRKRKKKRPASGPSTQLSRRSRLPPCRSANGERPRHEARSAQEHRGKKSPTQDGTPTKSVQPLLSPQRTRLTSRRLTGARRTVLGGYGIPECPGQIEYSKPLFGFSEEKLNLPLEDFDDPDTYLDLSPHSWIRLCANRRPRGQSEKPGCASAGPPTPEPNPTQEAQEPGLTPQSEQNLPNALPADQSSPIRRKLAKSPEQVKAEPSVGDRDSRTDKGGSGSLEEPCGYDAPTENGEDPDCWPAGDPSADSPEDARVLHFYNGSWQMVPCWVLGYIESEKRYRVRLKGEGTEKLVRRLALQFVEEDPSKCQGRAEGCRRRRERMRLRQGLINLIHRLPDKDFHPLSAPSRQKLLKRLLFSKGRGRLIKPDPAVVQQLVKELEDLYLFAMKYATVRHKTITLNGTPHAFLSPDTLQSKFGSLFLPLLPRPVKAGGYVPTEETEPVWRTVALLKRSPLFAREEIARVSRAHAEATLVCTCQESNLPLVLTT